MSRTSTWRNPTDHGGHRGYGRETLGTIERKLRKATPEEFEGHSMWASWANYGGENVYRVYSYETVIAEWWPRLDGGTLHLNMTDYSHKTQEHKGFVHLHLWHHNLRFNGPPRPHVVEWYDVAGDTYGLSDGKW